MTPWWKPETTIIFWSDFSMPEICRNGSQSLFIWCFQNKTENILICNLKLRRVQLTIIVVEIIKHYIFWACVWGVLIYPTCNAHAPYFHLWPLCLCNICPHYPINGTIFGTKLRNLKYVFWCDFDRASSLICGNKMPTKCNRWFLLQIISLAQHVSGTTMLIIRSSRVLYKWLLPVVFGALQQPANRTHNRQLHTIPTTWKPKHQIPQAATNCIILSSSWWWA